MLFLIADWELFPIGLLERPTLANPASRWVETEEVNLCTLGSLYSNVAGWVVDGEKLSAVTTSKWRSVCGSPLLSITQGRNYSDFILSLLGPGPLHLFLSFNEIINFLKKTLWPEVKTVLHDVGNQKSRRRTLTLSLF